MNSYHWFSLKYVKCRLWDKKCLERRAILDTDMAQHKTLDIENMIIFFIFPDQSFKRSKSRFPVLWSWFRGYFRWLWPEHTKQIQWVDIWVQSVWSLRLEGHTNIQIVYLWYWWTVGRGQGTTANKWRGDKHLCIRTDVQKLVLNTRSHIQAFKRNIISLMIHNFNSNAQTSLYHCKEITKECHYQG